MKEFSSELGQQYGTYTFGYAQYARREAGDALSALYSKGYLPYSGSPGVKDIFYRARSARVVLADFEFTSENRRIAKKFDGQFTREHAAMQDFVPDEAFYAFCLEYFKILHGEHAMPRERLEHLMQCGLISGVTTYRSAGAVVAYVLEVADDTLGHYWFSFYDLSYSRQSLGLWLMLDGVRTAQTRGLEHYYLGTVYGEKALYKTNFKPLEWWDGSAWSPDIAALKERGRTDNERAITLTDEWKRGLKFF